MGALEGAGVQVAPKAQAERPTGAASGAGRGWCNPAPHGVSRSLAQVYISRAGNGNPGPRASAL